MKNKKIKRNSSIELLKIIAMILIVFSHISSSLVKFIDYDNNGMESIIIWIFRNVGNIGNTIFIICSSWFLLDINSSDKEFKPNKAINILLDSCLVSIIIYVICVILKLVDTDIITVLSNIFPDVFRNVWFVPCYVIFYSITPLLSYSIKSLDRKKHLILCLISFCIYGVLGLFTLQPFYSELIEFILIYYCVAYAKYYLEKFNNDIKKNVFLFICFLLIYVSFLCFANSDVINVSYIFGVISTPLCMFLFNIFNTYNFNSKIINYISSCSLYVYCFHGNILLRGEIRDAINGYLLLAVNNDVLKALVIHSFSVFVISIIFSFLYIKTFYRISSKVSILMVQIFSLLIDKLL